MAKNPTVILIIPLISNLLNLQLPPPSPQVPRLKVD